MYSNFSFFLSFNHFIGALKIKEIAYVHAEGFSGGALKHGPFALLGNDTPIIFIIIDDQHEGKMRVAVEEVSVCNIYK
jgi:glucosamine--fructose-6-phosphate aminotransferase (isomerizing)